MRKIMIMSVADEDETLFDQIKECIQKKAEYNIVEINPVKKLSFGELTVRRQNVGGTNRTLF